MVSITHAMSGQVVEDSLQWDETMPLRLEKPTAASAVAQLRL